MENQTWECYICCKENDFNVLPKGYLANYHPLCDFCADKILRNRQSDDFNRMTYHKTIGDFIVVKKIIFKQESFN